MLLYFHKHDVSFHYHHKHDASFHYHWQINETSLLFGLTLRWKEIKGPTG